MSHSPAWHLSVSLTDAASQLLKKVTFRLDDNRFDRSKGKGKTYGSEKLAFKNHIPPYVLDIHEKRMFSNFRR